MATFPTKDADILALAHDMMNGLAHHTDIFPTPPTGYSALAVLNNTVLQAIATVVEAEAARARAVSAKRDAMTALKKAMTSDLRYAELVTHFDDDLLKLIGWSGWRHAIKLTAPGQALDLTIEDEGPGWIDLAWKAPVEGGAPSSYRVDRQRLGERTWIIAGVAFDKNLRLEDQERGVELLYRIVPINRVGEGRPGNVVVAVL